MSQTVVWSKRDMSTVVRQIADLETLPAGQLEARWRALFGSEAPVPRTLNELNAGIRRHIRTRHARG